MSWTTQRQAIARVRRAMRRGGLIVFHRQDCAAQHPGEECSCKPRYVVVRK